MGEKTLSFRAAITPLYLFGACLLADKMAWYRHPVEAFWIDAAFLLTLCLLCWVTVKLLQLLTRQQCFVLSGLLFLVLFFFSEQVLHFIQDHTTLFGFHNRDYLVLALLTTLAVGYAEKRWHLRKPALYLRMVKLVTTFLWILLVVSLSNMLWKNISEQPLANGPKLPAPRQNIAWILMDEYAASPVLQQYFGYHNELDSFLEKRGFILLDRVQSRFDRTLLSLYSIFNNDDSSFPPDLYTSLERLKKNAWTTAFEQEKVPFHNLDFAGIGNQPGIQSLYVFPDTYFKQLMYGSVLYGMLARLGSLETDTYNLRVKVRLDSLLQQTAVPGLIWAHFFVPHLPYLRDETGKLINADKPLTAGASLKKLYIGYLRYGNHLVEDIVTKDRWPDNRILIISGDHGARFPFINRKDYYRPYCAIRFPKGFDTSGLYRLRYISQLPGFITSH